MSNLLAIKQLSVKTKQNERILVRPIDLDFPEGKIIGIVGESGSGKSLSMKALMGLLPYNLEASFDEYQYEGVRISRSNFKKLRNSSISMIFQDPMTSLNPLRTIGFHLLEVIERFHKLKGKKARQEAIAMLHKIEIHQAEYVMQLYPHELSGGMIQRIMIAMALLKKPKLLIADEPTTALDVTVQAQILNLLKELQEEEQLTIALVTHDFGVVAEMCDYIYVMYQGVVVERGSANQIFYEAQHPYTQELLKAIPAKQDTERLYVMQPYHLSEAVKTHGRLHEVDDKHYVLKEDDHESHSSTKY